MVAEFEEKNWLSAIEKIKEKYCCNDNLDLVAWVKRICDEIIQTNADRIARAKANQHIQKSLKYLNYVSIPKNSDLRAHELLKQASHALFFKNGDKTRSINKIAISVILRDFYKLTGQKPICYWSNIKGCYEGILYQFLLDIQPILEIKEIHLGANMTIGNCLKEVLREQKETSKIEEINLIA